MTSKPLFRATWPLLIVFIFSGVTEASEASRMLETGQRLVARGEYRQGADRLKGVLREPRATLPERLNAMLALADFFETRVGDFRQSETYCRKIIQQAGGGHKKVRAAAEARLARLRRHAQDHAEILQFCAQARLRAVRPGSRLEKDQQRRLLEDVKRLESMISTAPEYRLRHEIHYLLGLIYFKLNRPWQADRQLSKAAAVKPAVSLYLPVERLQGSARSQWIRSLGRNSALAISGGLVVILLVGGLLSRPWQWLSWRHLLAGVVLVTLWAGAYWGLLWWIGENRHPGNLVNQDRFFPPPTYVEARWNAPGSEVAGVLFGYGTAALAAVYFFAAIGGRLRNRPAAVCISTAFALLAVASAMFLFYFQHCDCRSRYYADGAGAPGWMRSYLAFRLSEPEPYLLTDPASYPAIELDSINDPDLVVWLRRYQ